MLDFWISYLNGKCAIKFLWTFHEFTISQLLNEHVKYVCICCIDPQHNSPSISRFSFSLSSNCLRATSGYRTWRTRASVDVPVESSRCGRNQGSNRVGSEPGMPASCRFFRVIVIRYIRGTDAFLHRRACLCRARRRHTGGKREIE